MTKVKKPVAQRKWCTFRFWRNLFLYFWVFSFVGHVGEFPAAIFGNLIGTRTVPFSTIPLFAIAVPYGLGAVILRLVLYPPVQNKKLNLAATFLLSALLMTAVEFACAALLVAFTGHNYFWNYSDRSFNLFGFVCLGNSVMFGLGATVALKWVFPWVEKMLKKVKENYINVTFWVLFVGYILSQIWFRLIKG